MALSAVLPTCQSQLFGGIIRPSASPHASRSHRHASNWRGAVERQTLMNGLNGCLSWSPRQPRSHDHSDPCCYSDRVTSARTSGSSMQSIWGTSSRPLRAPALQSSGTDLDLELPAVGRKSCQPLRKGGQSWSGNAHKLSPPAGLGRCSHVARPGSCLPGSRALCPGSRARLLGSRAIVLGRKAGLTGTRVILLGRKAGVGPARATASAASSSSSSNNNSYDSLDDRQDSSPLSSSSWSFWAGRRRRWPPREGAPPGVNPSQSGIKYTPPSSSPAYGGYSAFESRQRAGDLDAMPGGQVGARAGSGAAKGPAWQAAAARSLGSGGASGGSDSQQQQGEGQPPHPPRPPPHPSQRGLEPLTSVLVPSLLGLALAARDVEIAPLRFLAIVCFLLCTQISLLLIGEDRWTLLSRKPAAQPPSPSPRVSESPADQAASRSWKVPHKAASPLQGPGSSQGEDRTPYGSWYGNSGGIGGAKGGSGSGAAGSGTWFPLMGATGVLLYFSATVLVLLVTGKKTAMLCVLSTLFLAANSWVPLRLPGGLLPVLLWECARVMDCGVLPVALIYYAQSAAVYWHSLLLLGLPLGLLAVAAKHAGNACHLADDQRNGHATVASRVHPWNSRVWLCALLVGAVASLLHLTWNHVSTMWVLLPLATGPRLWRLGKQFLDTPESELPHLERDACGLYTQFGLWLALGSYLC
eukprot:jgi/Mesvir1/427/Mv11309-RA.1